MLTVRFFASVREDLGCADLELPWSPQTRDLDALQAQLCRDREPRWRKVLYRDNMIRAVNQQVAQGNVPLSDGDEVAFYPPVTGG